LALLVSEVSDGEIGRWRYVADLIGYLDQQIGDEPIPMRDAPK
jgi:hypothetical protein